VCIVVPAGDTSGRRGPATGRLRVPALHHAAAAVAAPHNHRQLGANQQVAPRPAPVQRQPLQREDAQ